MTPKATIPTVDRVAEIIQETCRVSDDLAADAAVAVCSALGIPTASIVTRDAPDAVITWARELREAINVREDEIVMIHGHRCKVVDREPIHASVLHPSYASQVRLTGTSIATGRQHAMTISSGRRITVWKPLRAGDRVKLVRPVDRYPHFLMPMGSTGTVVDSGDRSLVEVEMDQPWRADIGETDWQGRVQWSVDNGDDPSEDLAKISA